MPRLFVAIYPPPDAAEDLLRRVGALSLPAHRVVAAGQVHVTLQFIGDRPAKELESVEESVRRAASGLDAFSLAPQRLISLPERGRRRLVAAETDAPPALLEIKNRLVTRLANRKREKRPFRPHLTLVRFRQPAAMQAVHLPLPAPAAFPVAHVHLMRSLLKPAGAEHHVVAAVEL